jgi:hypothetical protein
MVLKALGRVDSRVSAAEGSLSGVEDALTLARAPVAELEAELVEQAARAERERKATAISATIPPVREAFAAFEAATVKLIGALDTMPVPEARAMASWLREALREDMDGWKAQVPRFVLIAEGEGRRVLDLPPPTVEPAPPPVPVASPQPARDRYGAPIKPGRAQPPTTLGLPGAS